MARRNLSLGTAAGRIGDHVYFRRRGQQVIRVRVPAPIDRRSQRQGVVRAVFANSTNLWTLLRPFVEPSWRGYSRFGNAGNAFSHANRGQMPTASATMSRDGYAYPCTGLITNGSLPVSWQYRTELLQAIDGTGQYVPSMLFVGNAGTSNVETWGGLSSAIISASQGAREGDVLHFLLYVYSYDNEWSPAGALNQVPTVIHYSRVLDVSDEGYVADLFPLLRFDTKLVEVPYYQLYIQVAGLDVIFEPTDYNVGWALSSYLERPGLASSAAFTRSKFVMPTDERAFINASSVYGNISQQYGNTFIL